MRRCQRGGVYIGFLIYSDIRKAALVSAFQHTCSGGDLRLPSGRCALLGDTLLSARIFQNAGKHKMVHPVRTRKPFCP